MMIQTASKYEVARYSFRKNFSEGIKPVDGRQPIPDELALQMIQELEDLGVTKDSLIGVHDAFLILTTHLIEAGYRNIVVLESYHGSLTEAQEKYYNSIKSVCGNSGIKYYVPPSNNYSRCDMRFDVIIGNPPYQSSNGGGDKRGSGTNPLWWQITKTSLNLLKKDGILSFITPTNIVNGGDSFTKIFLGNERKYDLTKVDFTAADSFKVGIPICRWVASNKLTKDNNVVVTDGRILDTSDTFKISLNKTLDEILEKMFSYEGEKLVFNTENRYDFQNIQRYLEKQNLPKEWAKDLTVTPDDEHQYPVNINGKIKYSRIKWKNNGIWRVFYPQLQQPTKITVDNVAEAGPSTFTMVFDNEQDARRTCEYLTSPIYQWVIDQTRVSGRVTRIISSFPNAPIESVLSPEQISYIQSHL